MTHSDKQQIRGNILGNKIENAVIGVGVNVNQQQFVSDAPNPVSLFQILGRETERLSVIGQIMHRFMQYYDLLKCGELE